MADDQEDKGKKKEEETPTEEPKKEETPVEETTADETTDETSTDEVDETPEVEVSPEDIAVSVKNEFTQKILDAIGVSPKEAEDQDLMPPWEKEQRNPKNYGEIAEWSSQLAEKRLDLRRQEEQDRANEEADKTEQNTKSYNSALNSAWDEQLGEMRESGLIPQVDEAIAAKLGSGKKLNEEERSDPGLSAQRRLFELMYKVSIDRQKEGKKPVTSLKEVYYEHFNKDTDQPVGADAPVSGGEKVVTVGRSNEIDYLNDVKKKDFYQIMREGASS